MKVYDLSLDKVVIGLRVYSSANRDVLGTVASIHEDGEAMVVFENGVVNKFFANNCDLEVAGWEKFTSFPYWRK